MTAKGQESELNELRAIYETERRDEQNTAALIVAVTTGTLAYFSAASAYLGNESRQKSIDPKILMASPFPLLILTGYVTFQYAASRIRQSYLMHLERKISNNHSWERGVQYPGFMTFQQGMFSNWRKLFPFAALTVLTFLSHVIIVVGFTGYATYVAHERGVSSYVFWGLSALYSVIIIVNVGAVWMMIKYTVDPDSPMLGWLREAACETAASEKRRWVNSFGLKEMK
ncbi:hypothetical protein [Streptomyces sp. NPDC001759]